MRPLSEAVHLRGGWDSQPVGNGLGNGFALVDMDIEQAGRSHDSPSFR